MATQAPAKSRAILRGERYCPRKYRVRTMATAMAAAAPASPDVSTPLQLSALSTTAGLFNPAVPAKIVIETPQNPREQPEGTCRALVVAGTVLVQAGRCGFIVTARGGRYSGGCAVRGG